MPTLKGCSPYFARSAAGVQCSAASQLSVRPVMTTGMRGLSKRSTNCSCVRSCSQPAGIPQCLVGIRSHSAALHLPKTSFSGNSVTKSKADIGETKVVSQPLIALGPQKPERLDRKDAAQHYHLQRMHQHAAETTAVPHRDVDALNGVFELIC